MQIDWGAVGTLVVSGAGVLIALDARKTARERKAEVDAETARAKKNSADANESAAESVRILLDPLNTRITALDAQVQALLNSEKQLKAEREERERTHSRELATVKSEVNELRGGVQVLIAQLEAEGLTPRWRPKPKTGPLGGK